mgnify:CR=1 FL=1
MITTQKMKELEEKSLEVGITKQQLMENAGKGISDVIKEKYDIKNKKILIVCYHGNNGGDGFVSARYLSDIAEVDVLFIGDEQKLKNSARLNYMKLLHNERIQFVEDSELIDFDDFDIIIDAILGIGFYSNLRDDIKDIIQKINDSKAIKIAVDVPTGINADTGAKGERYVNADLIITLHDIKQGLMDIRDKCVVVDIGL